MPLVNKMTNLIADDEGFRGHLYKDSKGFNTIGFGFNLDVSEIPIGISLLWLDEIVENISYNLSNKLALWVNLNDARQYVLVNMAYQMGISGLLKFREMLIALEGEDYEKAAFAMKDSQWYREFTNRASRLTKIMITGEF